MYAKSLQSCLTLCDPMDCNLPGTSVHGILQARIVEWVAMPSSKNLPDPGIEPVSLKYLLHCQAHFLPLVPLGKPQVFRAKLRIYIRVQKYLAPGKRLIKNNSMNKIRDYHVYS